MDYNPHYKCKMDKDHITMIGNYPVFMKYKDGLGSNSAELLKHIWYHLNAKPIVFYSYNTVLNNEGEIERVDNWINKIWKLGGDVHAKIENKLKLLYENRRQEQVGMCLRNQKIVDELFLELYKKRGECQKVHGHIKDAMKFDSRRIRVESKALYSLLNFIAYQLLVLTELQNKVKVRNLFGRFF